MQRRISPCRSSNWRTLVSRCALVGTLGLLAPLAANAQDSTFNTFGVQSEEYLALNQDIVNRVIVMNEYLLNLKFTATERKEFGDILRRYWEKEDGKLMKTVRQMLPMQAQMEELPEQTRQLARRSTVLTFLLGLEKNAKKKDEVSVLMIRAYQRVHPPVVPDTPFVSEEIADAFIDAYLFVNEVKSGKKAPKMSAEARTKMRKGIATDFAKIPAKKRDEFIEKMGRATNLLINWDKMESWERLLTRAEVGAPLSPQEQQTAQQLRHRLQQHSMRMAIGELNFIARTQQDIMGSAPYWNPASQSWEQKGGIVTEFK